MQPIKTLFFGLAALASTVAAQAGIAITSIPQSFTVGQPATITWQGSSEPVTLILRRGDPNNLQTVSTLTTSGANGAYTWTPDASLTSGTDYAIEIRQAGQVNYSPLFAITGGAASSVSQSAVSTTSSVASSISTSASSETTSYSSDISSHLSSHLSSHVSSYISAAHATANATTTSTTLTAVPSVGTVISLPHANSTISTLEKTTRTTLATKTESTVKATSSVARNATASATPSSTPLRTNSAAGIASPLALVLTAFAAIVYLN